MCSLSDKGFHPEGWKVDHVFQRASWQNGLQMSFIFKVSRRWWDLPVSRTTGVSFSLLGISTFCRCISRPASSRRPFTEVVWIISAAGHTINKLLSSFLDVSPHSSVDMPVVYSWRWIPAPVKAAACSDSRRGDFSVTELRSANYSHPGPHCNVQSSFLLTVHHLHTHHLSPPSHTLTRLHIFPDIAQNQTSSAPSSFLRLCLHLKWICDLFVNVPGCVFSPVDCEGPLLRLYK